jgi:tRNA A-37 threonylcarbamoyl transferase component Bud32
MQQDKRKDLRSELFPNVADEPGLPDGRSATPLGSGFVTKIICSDDAAVTYEIWNSDLEIKRAVKLQRIEEGLEAEEEFQRTMKICAKLHHPNIVEIYAIGSWNDLPYIEMEVIEGFTLAKLISQAGKLPPEVCTSIAIMVGRALNYAHNRTYTLFGAEHQGILHGNLRPANIMISREGTLKLIDFGVSAASDPAQSKGVGGAARERYLAPEQLEGKETDARTDIYSLATVMYEMLAGTAAFGEPESSKLLSDKSRNRWPTLDHGGLGFPRPLRDLVEQCMNSERKRRASSALQFLRTLGKIHKTLTELSPEEVVRRFMGQREGARLVGEASAKRTGFVVVLCILAIIAGAVAIGFWYLMRVGDSQGDRGTGGTGRTGAVQPALPAGTERPGAPPTSAGAETARGQKEASAVPGAPEGKERREQVPEPRMPSAMLDNLKKQYATNDALAVFVLEVNARHFKRALQVWGHLPSAATETKKAKLYRLRALAGAKREPEIARILASDDIADGEFYLQKAERYYRARDLGNAQQFFTKALSTYGMGLCASAIFDAAPLQSNKEGALRAWSEVRAAFRASPDDPHAAKAEQEIHRIATADLIQ